MVTTAISYFCTKRRPYLICWLRFNYAILQKCSRQLLDVGYVTIIDNSNKFKTVVDAILNWSAQLWPTIPNSVSAPRGSAIQSTRKLKDTLKGEIYGRPTDNFRNKKKSIQPF